MSGRSSIFFSRIVSSMFMRVNVRCAHQLRPPRRRISGSARAAKNRRDYSALAIGRGFSDGTSVLALSRVLRVQIEGPQRQSAHIPNLRENSRMGHLPSLPGRVTAFAAPTGFPASGHSHSYADHRFRRRDQSLSFTLVVYQMSRFFNGSRSEKK